MPLIRLIIASAVAAAVAAPAYAQTPASAPASFMSGPAGSIGMLVVMFGLLYFLIIRPQTQRQKKHQQMIAGVKRGDTVVLASGVIGKVVRVEDTEVGVEVAQGVTVKVMKGMIADVRVKGLPAPANDVKEG